MNKETSQLKDKNPSAADTDQALIISLYHMLLLQQDRINDLTGQLEKANEERIHDDLTGLKRKPYFIENLESILVSLNYHQSEKRAEVIDIKHVSVLFIDIDYFKVINDTYGHQAGDQILQAVACSIKNNLRKMDVAARLGGEEMGISLWGADEKQAVAKAEQLRELIKKETQAKFSSIYPDLICTFSIGVASATPGISAEELIDQADQAMYVAKKTGKNRVKCFSSLTAAERQLIQSPTTNSSR